MDIGALKVCDKLSIPENEIEYDFCRSSGPGGQHVNTTDTSVTLRFNVLQSPSLSEDVRTRLLMLGGYQINNEGVLIITSQKFRRQLRNKFDVREKFINLLLKALNPPLPRKSTKPPQSGRLQRLETKKRQSEIKQQRRKVELP